MASSVATSGDVANIINDFNFIQNEETADYSTKLCQIKYDNMSYLINQSINQQERVRDDKLPQFLLVCMPRMIQRHGVVDASCLQLGLAKIHEILVLAKAT